MQLRWVILATVLPLTAWGQIVAPSGQGPSPNLPQISPHAVGDEAQADAHFAAGRYSQAADEYAALLRREPDNPALLLKYGDALNQIASMEMQNLSRARHAWERAVEKDPSLVEGHRRLMNLWIELADLSPSTRGVYLNKARDSAEAILRHDPLDRRARFVQQLVPIELYIAGSAADPQRVVDAIDALQALAPTDPENPDIPFTIARGQARLALDAMKLLQREETQRLATAAVATMDDALKQRPRNPGLLWRKAQVLHTLIALGASEEDDASTRDSRLQQHARINELATAAFNLASRDDPELVPMAQYAAAMQHRVGFTDAAETIYRKVLETHPEENTVKLQLVEILRQDPSRSEEMIELLEQVARPPKPRAGLAGMIALETQHRAQIALVDARLESYLIARESGDPGAAAMLPAIEEDLERLRKRQGDTPNMLRLRGKMQLFKGEYSTAAETLNRALLRATEPSDRLRYEIMYLLARTFQKQGRGEDAEKLYTEIVDRLDYPPARKELARLLLERKSYPEARPHIESLRKTSGADPEVLKLQVTMLEWESRGDPAAMRDLLERMPEDAIDSRLHKARLALMAGHPTITRRLVEPLYQQYHDDARLAVLLANATEAGGDIPGALAVLQEYVGRHPNVPAVKKVIARLEATGKTP
ncbi:MAG: tetratricopeptide repeat protein [Phycisphaerae bacterium]|nr:tetratricopeptide repeat protein [Phycisphaerae bacterium]MDW8261237.1 tetratricopeptide repeat protein [Phycisphaerales bacterium]